MKYLHVFIAMVSLLPFALGQKDPYVPVFYVGVRPGFNILGIGRELKFAMKQEGLTGSGLFGGEAYPTQGSSIGAMGEFEYRKRPFGVGLEAGISASGNAKGVIRDDPTLLFFTGNVYFNMDYRVTSFAPYFRIYALPVSLHLGVSWNHWQVSSDSIALHRSYKGRKWGAVAGFALKVYEAKHSRMEFTALYRYIGPVKVGEFGALDENGIQLIVFNQQNINFSHVLIGLTMDFAFVPKRYRYDRNKGPGKVRDKGGS